MEKFTPSPLLRFGAFEVDPRTGELLSDGCKLQLHEQPLHLLLALLERPGELVTREELISRLWPAGTFVDFDRGLNKAVNKLRDALADSAENPRFIETLPRKGYRFIGPVAPASPASKQVAAEAPTRPSRGFWLAVVAAGGVACLALMFAANVFGTRNWIMSRLRPVPRIGSLAVLPLETLSRDPEQEYFADGMTDALITNLAKMGETRVVSRTSVMRYQGTRKSLREVGRELNVDAVVEGTVMRSGNRVRITAQLIQVATDTHLWAESYERDLSAILDLQKQVARDIARQIGVIVRPVPRAGAVNPEAYAAYLKGRYFFYQYTDDGWRKAIDYFNQAIRADANFALAYSGLADSYLVAGAYWSIPTQEALTKGKAAALKALQLDDTLGDAHFALGVAHTWYDWDWGNAEKEFRRGFELNPNDALGHQWYGAHRSLQGDLEKGIAEQRRALELDPNSLIINANLARSYYWARQYDQAIAQAKETLKIDPTFGVALFWLEASYRHKGMIKEAVALRRAVSSPERAAAIAKKFRTEGFRGLLLENAESLIKAGAIVQAGRCYAQTGMNDQAFALLEKCYQTRCANMVSLKVDPTSTLCAPIHAIRTCSGEWASREHEGPEDRGKAVNWLRNGP